MKVVKVNEFVEPKITKEEFLRNLIIELASDEYAPVDIHNVKFDVRERIKTKTTYACEDRKCNFFI